MKNFTQLKTLIIILLTLLGSLSGFSQSTAIYDITFTSVWNSTDHGTLPGNAHWSKLVGSNHNSNVTFLQMGQLASNGIELVAEEGDNTGIYNEVMTSVSAGNAQQYIDGNSLSTATGTITITGLQISETFPLLTLVSMIAPSPDWMIAISGVNLRDGSTWKPSISLDVYPYDAGTDDGMMYVATNMDTNPKQPIVNAQGIMPFGSQKIGTLVITLQSVLGIEDQTTNLKLQVYPNPSNGIINFNATTSNPIKNSTVYDVFGKQVAYFENTSQNETLTYNLSTLNNGVYILKVTFNDGSNSSKKLIIN